MIIIIIIQIQIVATCCINIGSPRIQLSNKFNYLVQTIAVKHIIHLWDMINQLLYDYTFDECIQPKLHEVLLNQYLYLNLLVSGLHINDCEHLDDVPSIFPHQQQLTEGIVRLHHYKNAKKRKAGVYNGVPYSQKGEQWHLQEVYPTEASLPESTGDIRLYWAMAKFHTRNRLQLP